MSKKSFLKEKSENRLIRQYWLIRSLVVVMCIVVVYDAFIHDTPLYYIGFYYVGLVLGRVFLYTQRIEHNQEAGQLTLVSSRWNLILIVVLLVFRYVFGKYVLEHMHVVLASDALYLIFIGVYRSRYKSLVSQVDDLVYDRLNDR